MMVGAQQRRRERRPGGGETPGGAREQPDWRAGPRLYDRAMTWFFAVIVVAVMGGIAVVAAGAAARWPSLRRPARRPGAGRRAVDRRRTCAGCGSRPRCVATGCPRWTRCSTGSPPSSNGARDDRRTRRGTRRRLRVRCASGWSARSTSRPRRGRVWDYVTDWPRQEEWIPLTRVENVDDAASLGGRFRAWTGRRAGRLLGPDDDHRLGAHRRRRRPLRGAAPRRGGQGEGEFAVVARGEGASRFVWAEMVVLPAGARGCAGLARRTPGRGAAIDRGLRGMRDQVEAAPLA